MNTVSPTHAVSFDVPNSLPADGAEVPQGTGSSFGGSANAMAESTSRRGSVFRRMSMFGQSLFRGSGASDRKKRGSADSFVEDGEGGEGEGGHRALYVASPARNKAYNFPPNFLKTSNYTAWNFLPLNLFNQFHEISNIYFFIVMCVSVVPHVSPITPASAVAPLIIVLTTAAFKDGYQDWKRHIADYKDNSAKADVLRDGEWTSTPSMDIHVGDVIRMARGKAGEACAVKADVVLLASSDEDGVVYVETSQLDGETSMKPRKSAGETQELCQTPEGIKKLAEAPKTGGENAEHKGGLLLMVDQPNPKIYTWQGVLTMPDGTTSSLSTKNIIWRGSSMRKTEWAVGVVIYTGKHTKQGKNLKKSKRKLSTMTKQINTIVGGIFAFKHVLLFPLCSLSVWWREANDGHWYLSTLRTQNTGFETFCLNYMTYFVLLSFLIPISLFVTVELCRVNQILLMKWDSEMMHYMKGLGWVGCRPKTSDLNEQLAVVRYIFSDKTGTLTENIMRYMEGAVLSGGRWVTHQETTHDGAIDRSVGGLGAATQFSSLLSTSGGVSDDVGRYIACMALCHTVVPFTQGEGPEEVTFEGSSPDEVALVQCASWNRFVLTKRTSKMMVIRTGEVEHTYDIMQELEFSPTRKMMSVIIRDEEHRYILLCKGADSSVFPQVLKATMSDEAAKDGQQRVSGYAARQFRTLCLAYREIPEAEYNAWVVEWNATQCLLGKTDEMVDDVCLKIERRLSMIGISAYEDKLQDGVPETIRFLTDAGMVVWMLTGDKLETGIEIGKTCGLAEHSEIIAINVLREEDENDESMNGAPPPAGPEGGSGGGGGGEGNPTSGDGPKGDDPSAPATVETEAEIEAAVAGLSDASGLNAVREARMKDARERRLLRKIRDAHARTREVKQNPPANGSARVTIAIDGPTVDIMQFQDGEVCGIFFASSAPPPPPSPPLSFCDFTPFFFTRPSLNTQKILEREFVQLSTDIHSAVCLHPTRTTPMLSSHHHAHPPPFFFFCATQICCRLTPGQKGYIVTLFQRESGETALAIGDGANDATMISAANVGIGIIGLEGSQAELASDYAIPRFRFLKRLLVVHGRYCKYRTSRCVCFSFYKNIALSLGQVFFAMYSGFSGTTLYDSWLLAIKNTVFSSLPPLLVGCYGKDISEEVLMDRRVGPRLYAQMREGLYFDVFSIWSWFLTAVVHGTAIFWMVYPLMLADDTDVHSGRNGGLIQTGTYAMSMVVYCVVTKAAVHLHIINVVQAGGIIFSYLLYPSWVAAYAAVPSVFGDTAFYGMGEPLFSDPKHYLISVATVFLLVVCIDFSALFVQRRMRPSLRDLCADHYSYKVCHIHTHTHSLSLSLSLQFHLTSPNKQDPPWSSARAFFGCCSGTSSVRPADTEAVEMQQTGVVAAPQSPPADEQHVQVAAAATASGDATAVAAALPGGGSGSGSGEGDKDCVSNSSSGRNSGGARATGVLVSHGSARAALSSKVQQRDGRANPFPTISTTQPAPLLAGNGFDYVGVVSPPPPQQGSSPRPVLVGEALAAAAAAPEMAVYGAPPPSGSLASLPLSTSPRQSANADRLGRADPVRQSSESCHLRVLPLTQPRV